MSEYPFQTLPDYLAPGLDLVLVGTNPSVYAVERGHCFDRRTSRSRPAFSRSVLSAGVRAGLGRDVLVPEADVHLLESGIGLTDVVRVPTINASQLSDDLFREWAPRLLARLQRLQPTVASLHGATAFRPFARCALGERHAHWQWAPQPLVVGQTRLFVTPDPSPANAHLRPEDYAAWYDWLALYVAGELPT